MTAVVDAAAAMSLMRGERGGDVVAGVIKGSLVTAINVSERCSCGVERGATALARQRRVPLHTADKRPSGVADAMSVDVRPIH